MARYMRTKECPVCHGQRLKPESLAVTIDKFNIFEVTELSLKIVMNLLINLKLKGQTRKLPNKF